jgi:hypothetical protein
MGGRMSETLTYEGLRVMWRRWERELGETVPISPLPSALAIIEVDPLPIYSPVRRHRKRRIQRKWIKRYGMKVAGEDHFLGDQVYVHEKLGTAFCHSDVARLM